MKQAELAKMDKKCEKCWRRIYPVIPAVLKSGEILNTCADCFWEMANLDALKVSLN